MPAIITAYSAKTTVSYLNAFQHFKGRSSITHVVPTPLQLKQDSFMKKL
jgi:hypothetical protein